MDRMACVNLPAFPLQLLVHQHPDWKSHPVAVVDRDKPQGVILWVSKGAARLSILPGMRYAKGLSLAPDLRAGTVPDAEIEKHIGDLTERLRFFTPDVEPSQKEPGVFWLNASGLSLLYPSLKKWAGLVASELSQAGFFWSIAVGFSRYATYATAKTSAGSSKAIVVFDTLETERQHARALPVIRLGFPPDLRDALAQLAIKTLGGFVDLPEDGIRKRFGAEAFALYKLARNELFCPMAAVAPEDPLVQTIWLDHRETRIDRLIVRIEKLLDAILIVLKKRNTLLVAVALDLGLDNGERRHELLRPAAPTLDGTQVLRLIELRLQNVSLVSGVVEIKVDAEAARIHDKQLELFYNKTRRDLHAANRAFAQLRAEFGNRVVMRARLRDGHLPEACYEWEPMEKLSLPAPRKIKARNLVRRIFARSTVLASWARRRADGRPLENLLVSATNAENPDVSGPYIVSGGWWMRRVHREYYFVRSPQGQWLWIYYDRHRKRSFIQGAVE